MAITLGDIADRLGLPLDGDRTLPVAGLCGLSDNLPGYLSFVRDPGQLSAAVQSRVPAFVTRPDERVPGRSNLLHANPELAMARIAELFQVTGFMQAEAVHPSACVSVTAVLADGVQIGAHCTIGDRVIIGRASRILPGSVIGSDVRIGEHCIVHPNCVIRESVTLGNRVILQPGVILGGDGFGYVWDGEQHVKIPQLGSVVVEDDVEIGANSTIDRGRFTTTRIGRGTKIDNLVMIAHNVQVGQHGLLVAQSGVAGSTRLGDRVTFAGQVGIVGHIDITDDVTILGQSMVTRDIRDPGTYAGSPARPAAIWHRAVAAFYRAARRR